MSQAARVVESAELMSPLQLQLRQAIRLADEAAAALEVHQNTEIKPVERLITELQGNMAEHKRKLAEVVDRANRAPEKKSSRADLELIGELNAAITLTQSRLDGAQTRLAAVNRVHGNFNTSYRSVAADRDVLAEQCAWEDFKALVRTKQLEMQREYMALEMTIAGARNFSWFRKAADENTKSLIYNEGLSWCGWQCPGIADGQISPEAAAEYGRYLERKRQDATATFWG